MDKSPPDSIRAGAGQHIAATPDRELTGRRTAGSTSCEETPGVREFPFGKLYLAYLGDPDGTKPCAMLATGQ